MPFRLNRKSGNHLSQTVQGKRMDHIELADGEKETVYSWLREYNHEVNGDFMRSLEIEGTEIPVFLSARNEKGEVIGGLEGIIIHKWLKIDIMAVEPDQRRKGTGTELIERAENIAIERGCEFAFVDTMSYQAPGFYERLGYDVVGRIPDWDSHGHDKLYFTKNLLPHKTEQG